MQTSQPPHSQDLRKGRRSQLGQIYLITTRCYSKQLTFLNFKLGQIVVDAIERSDAEGGSKTLAFVVMPDHIHWLLELTGNQSLSGIVGRVKGRVSRQINLIRNAQAPVWQSGFNDRALRRTESIRSVRDYILNNPVRAGLVSHYLEYPLLFTAWLGEGEDSDNRG